VKCSGIYTNRSNYIVYFRLIIVLRIAFYKDKKEFNLHSLKFPLIPYLFKIFLDWLALMCVIVCHNIEFNCVITGGKNEVPIFLARINWRRQRFAVVSHISSLLCPLTVPNITHFSVLFVWLHDNVSIIYLTEKH